MQGICAAVWTYDPDVCVVEISSVASAEEAPPRRVVTPAVVMSRVTE
jgi:hypothetical protein